MTGPAAQRMRQQEAELTAARVVELERKLDGAVRQIADLERYRRKYADSVAARHRLEAALENREARIHDLLRMGAEDRQQIRDTHDELAARGIWPRLVAWYRGRP